MARPMPNSRNTRRSTSPLVKDRHRTKHSPVQASAPIGVPTKLAQRSPCAPTAALKTYNEVKLSSSPTTTTVAKKLLASRRINPIIRTSQHVGNKVYCSDL